MTALPNKVVWRFPQPALRALTALVGSPLGLRGRALETRFGPQGMATVFTGLSLFQCHAPHTAARIETGWHTTACGFDWHAWTVTSATDEPCKSDHLVRLTAHSPLTAIEAVTLDFDMWRDQDSAPRQFEDLSLDAALNLIFANGEVLNLTTDFDSILGAVVVSHGRFDPATLDWEGLTAARRNLTP